MLFIALKAKWWRKCLSNITQLPIPIYNRYDVQYSKYISVMSINIYVCILDLFLSFGRKGRRIQWASCRRHWAFVLFELPRSPPSFLFYISFFFWGALFIPLLLFCFISISSLFFFYMFANLACVSQFESALRTMASKFCEWMEAVYAYIHFTHLKNRRMNENSTKRK